MSSATEQIWDRTRRKLHPILSSEVPGLFKLIPFDSGTPSVAVGVNDTYGPDTVLSLPPNTQFLFITALQYMVSGVFGGGEIVTVKITFTYGDDTTDFIERTFTINATFQYGPFSDEIKKAYAKLLKGIKFNAKTNQASTNVTVNMAIEGFAY